MSFQTEQIRTHKGSFFQNLDYALQIENLHQSELSLRLNQVKEKQVSVSIVLAEFISPGHCSLRRKERGPI